MLKFYLFMNGNTSLYISNLTQFILFRCTWWETIYKHYISLSRHYIPILYSFPKSSCLKKILRRFIFIFPIARWFPSKDIYWHKQLLLYILRVQETRHSIYDTETATIFLVEWTVLNSIYNTVLIDILLEVFMIILVRVFVLDISLH